MHLQFTPYILPLLAAAVMSCWVIFYSWARRGTAGAISLSVLALVITEWLVGYALEIAGADLPTKLFFGKLQYIGIAFTPLFWLIFAYNHAHHARSMDNRTMGLLAILPLTT